MSLEGFTKNLGRVNVPDVGRNEVSDVWTAGGERALPKLGPCPNDNSCVSCRITELSASGFLTVKFNDVSEVCRAALMENGVHHGGDLELNSCLHRQPVKCSAGLIYPLLLSVLGMSSGF